MIALTMFVAATGDADARGAPPQNDARAADARAADARAADARAADARAPTPTPRARRAPNARTITFTYDNAGRVTEANYGSGSRIAFTYDFSGDLTAMQTFAVDLRIFFPVILK
ncbi:MAG: RHS repeat protein [Chloroflexi bacterium]|nr:RHS repeat protein [Chloroflexota bacterium]